jgi:hypothetical protein
MIRVSVCVIQAALNAEEVITMPGRQSVGLLVMLMACWFFVPKVTADLIYVPNGVAGNISEDPRFCNLGSEDFTLAEDSPCAPYSPPNEECYLIGAWPVGCDQSAVGSATWGSIKAMYRR